MTNQTQTFTSDKARLVKNVLFKLPRNKAKIEFIVHYFEI